MQTTVQTIPAGTAVQTIDGRLAVTLDDTTVVTNSETGLVTTTNLVKFSDGDGGERTWDTRELTPIADLRAVRLIDPYGYTVAVRYVRDGDVEAATRQLLDTVAPEHADQWAALGFDYHVTGYSVV